MWAKGGAFVFALLVSVQGGLSLNKEHPFLGRRKKQNLCHHLSPLFLHVSTHGSVNSVHSGAPTSCATCVQSTVTVTGTVSAIEGNCSSAQLPVG